MPLMLVMRAPGGAQRLGSPGNLAISRGVSLDGVQYFLGAGPQLGVYFRVVRIRTLSSGLTRRNCPDAEQRYHCRNADRYAAKNSHRPVERSTESPGNNGKAAPDGNEYGESQCVEPVSQNGPLIEREDRPPDVLEHGTELLLNFMLWPTRDIDHTAPLVLLEALPGTVSGKSCHPPG